jgi:hypothetical protein
VNVPPLGIAIFTCKQLVKPVKEATDKASKAKVDTTVSEKKAEPIVKKTASKKEPKKTPVQNKGEKA